MNGAHISATTSKPSKDEPAVFIAALLNFREGVFRYLVNLVIISMSTNVAPSRCGGTRIWLARAATRKGGSLQKR